MWIDISKKIPWVITVMVSCFLSALLVGLIAQHFNIKILHDSLFGLVKVLTILFFIPMYVAYKSMFIFGYVTDKSEINSEIFWGVLIITQCIPAIMGLMFAKNLYFKIF